MPPTTTTATTGQTADHPADRILVRLTDTERYPLLARGSARYRDAVELARAGLADVGCARLDGFVRPEWHDRLRSESLALAPAVEVKQATFTPYVGIDDRFPEGHPRRHVQTATNGFVTRDLIPSDTLVQQLYASPAFMAFLADCFGKEQLHQFADPMRGLVINVMPEGTTLPWHFDANEFVVSLMTVAPDRGGAFEYCPSLRSPGSENYDAVAAVLDGDRTPVRTLELAVGDLQLFTGRYSLHQVREAVGERHTAVFGYSEDPGYIGSVKSTIQAFGRCMQAHRDNDSEVLADGLDAD